MSQLYGFQQRALAANASAPSVAAYAQALFASATSMATPSAKTKQRGVIVTGGALLASSLRYNCSHQVFTAHGEFRLAIGVDEMLLPGPWAVPVTNTTDARSSSTRPSRKSLASSDPGRLYRAQAEAVSLPNLFFSSDQLIISLHYRPSPPPRTRPVGSRRSSKPSSAPNKPRTAGNPVPLTGPRECSLYQTNKGRDKTRYPPNRKTVKPNRKSHISFAIRVVLCIQHPLLYILRCDRK